jgi:uncharacterized protein GlcG (DUF336 family)
MFHRILLTAVLLAAAAPSSAAELPHKPVLTLGAAKEIVSLAVAEARQRKSPGGTFTIADDGGHLLYLERLDGTFPMSAYVGTGKAHTSAMFRVPTEFFESTINKGRTAMAGLEGFTPLQGGVPITVGGHVVGAIGISGAGNAQQDEEIALAALEQWNEGRGAAQAVRHFDAATVRDLFARGKPILEADLYKIHASRRTAPGEAEVHTRDTDLIYVLEGSATFVTGGTAVDARETAPEELRGSRIDGGDARTLKPGDVVVVPNGTPHWFKEASAPFLYYVVKVRAP